MSATSHCPKCQRPLAASSPHELCPACLLQALMADDATPNLPNQDGANGNPANRQHATVRYFGDYELLGEIAKGGMLAD